MSLILWNSEILRMWSEFSLSDFSTTLMGDIRTKILRWISEQNLRSKDQAQLSCLVLCSVSNAKQIDPLFAQWAINGKNDAINYCFTQLLLNSNINTIYLIFSSSSLYKPLVCLKIFKKNFYFSRTFLDFSSHRAFCTFFILYSISFAVSRAYILKSTLKFKAVTIK